MTADQLKARTKLYSLSIIDLVEMLPTTTASKIIAHQIAKSGTSVGANYRAVCRARSDKEFIAKMEIVLEETNETLFWLEIIMDKNWLNKTITETIWKEMS
jgi:four helix bundle protein